MEEKQNLMEMVLQGLMEDKENGTLHISGTPDAKETEEQIKREQKL